jgi:hypothetical protein
MTALRACITIGLAALWFVLAAPPMFRNPPMAYTGVQVVDTGALVQRTIVQVAPGSPAARAGLRTGDAVSCLSPRDSALLLQPQGIAAYAPGVSIHLCVRRNGAWIPVTVTPQERAPIGYLYSSIGVVVLRLAVFALFLFVGIALVMARPSPLTWIFFVYCLGSVPSYSTSLLNTTSSSLAYTLTAVLLNFSTATAVAFMLLFAFVVPDDRVPAGWRRIPYAGAWAITIGLSAFLVFSFARTDLTFSISLSNGIDEALTAVTVLVVVARLFAARGAERSRFAWAAFAIISGVIANDVRNVLASGSYSAIGTLSGLLTVIMPLALMYAILKRHVIDVRFVISRTVVYAAITTLVVGIIGAVDWATSAYLAQARVAMALDALVTIGLGFALHRTYRWIEYGVDFLLYRKKHEAESYLNRLARTLLRASREETIDRALVRDPFESLDLSMTALFRAEGSSFALSCAAGWKSSDAPPIDRDHDLIRFLLTERTRLKLRGLRRHIAAHFFERGATPTLVLPIFQGEELAAFAVYGVHRDGTDLDPDEVDALEHLCETAAQGYMRIENDKYRSLMQRPLTVT